MTSPRFGIPVAAIAVAAASFAWSPTSAQQTPMFRAAVDLVNLDVTVLDKQGRPAKGLVASDFTVLEDGKPQAIQTFAEVNLPASDPKAAAWTRDVAPDVHSNTAADDERLLVIAIDDAMLPADPALVNNTKRAAKSVIAKLGGQDLAALVFTNNSSAGQEFTHDHARLLAAAESTESGGYTLGTGGADPSIAVSSADFLRRLAMILGTVTNRRKAVIWISIGAPANPLEISNSVPAQRDLTVQWAAAMDALRRANVNVFSVDPGGVDGVRALAARGGGTPMTTFGAGRMGTSAGSPVPSFRDFLQALSDNTGGRLYVGTNDLDTKIDDILRDTGSFYLLGYPSTPNSNGARLRKIQVKVSKPGLTARTRTGYYPVTPEAARAAAAKPITPVVAALSGLLPRRDLPLHAVAASLGSQENAPGAAIVAVTVNPQSDAPIAGIDVLVEAFGADGSLVASQHARASHGPRSAAKDWDASTRLELPAGKYQLRIAAGGGALGVGSVFSDLDIVDYAKTPLSWSGTVVGRTGDRRGLLGPGVPITPLTSRTFGKKDEIEVFARLYQGGQAPLAPVTLHTRLVDEANTALLNVVETIAPARFNEVRATDVIRVLPLSKLPSGGYLFSLEASIGKTTVRKDVRFAVK